MFKVGKTYSVHEMSGGEYRMAYDGFYAVVDGKLEALSMWQDELANELMEQEKIPEDQAYKDAEEDILFHLGMVYEGARNIAAFKGIAPGKAFDFYSDYKCIQVEEFPSYK